MRKKPTRKAIFSGINEAAAFLQSFLDWKGVVIDISWDRWGGFRVEKIHSPLSKHRLGWDRRDPGYQAPAIVLAVEEFVLAEGSTVARRRLRNLVKGDE